MDHGIQFGIFPVYKEESPASVVRDSQKGVTSSGKLSCRKFPTQPNCSASRSPNSGQRMDAVFDVSPRLILFSRRPPRRDWLILTCVSFPSDLTNQVVPHVFRIFCLVDEQRFQGRGHARAQHLVHKRPAHGVHFGASATSGSRLRFPRHVGYPENCRWGR